MQPIKTIRTILDVIEEVDRLKKIDREDPKLHRLVLLMRHDLYVEVLKLLAQSCSEFVRDLACEALNAEDIGGDDASKIV